MAEFIKSLNSSDNIYDYINNLKVNEIEDIIIYASDKYYNTSNPVISDAIYDILIDFLRQKNPKSKILSKVGSESKSKKVEKLDYWLGSMNKIKPTSNQLSIWTNKYNPPYNLSDKLDGISTLLIYKFSGEIKLFTRGTAEKGTNISSLLKYLKIPSFEDIEKYCNKNKIKGTKNLIALRGELIIKEDIFKKKWNENLKNSRNAIAGLVNSIKINPIFAVDSEIVTYEIIDPFYKIEKQLEILSNLNFNVVHNININHELNYTYLSEYFKERKQKSIYNIDGIIVTSCSLNQRNIKGNPEYAFAFKDILDEQIAITKVIDIEWNPSKDGYLIPTLILTPVTIGGVEIKRTSGFNAKYIIDNSIGPNTEIELIRSGDVIPYIKKVIKSTKPQLPKDNWHWTKSGVHIKLNTTKNNLKVIIKNIYFFFSNLNAKGLGLKTIEKIVNSGLDTIQKILNSNYNDYMNIEGFKDKTINNILDQIKKCTQNIPLYKLMAASNILGHGIGEEKIKLILNLYPNILNNKWSNEEFINNLNQINGWDTKSSSLFVSNFDKFIDFYKSINKYFTFKNITPSKTQYLLNKIIVFSGFRDKELEELITNNGGKVTTSISKNTSYLIVKNINDISDKINKAKQLNITIIEKNEFLKLFNI